jgi:hypothetical protein
MQETRPTINRLLEGIVFWGVIEDVRLVHIYGKGTVISPDGSQTQLYEPEVEEP